MGKEHPPTGPADSRFRRAESAAAEGRAGRTDSQPLAAGPANRLAGSGEGNSRYLLGYAPGMFRR